MVILKLNPVRSSFVLSLLAVLFVFVSPSISVSADERQDRVAELIQQLGADSFADREDAMKELIEIGLPASDMLAAAVRDPDREVRFRAQRALSVIERDDLNKRIRRFMVGDIEGTEAGLPGWDRFSKLMGDSEKTRQIFVDMQKVEYNSLKMLEENPEGIGALIASRANQLRDSFPNPNQPIDPAHLAALLFLATEPEVDVDEQTYLSVYYLCSNGAVQKALEHGDYRDPLRKLLAPWILRAEGVGTYQALLLAMRNDLREGLELAERLLSEDPEPASHVKRYALQTVAKFGSKENASLAEKFFNDESRISARTIGPETFSTQVRDLALAVAIKLNGEQLEKYGFENVTYDDDLVFVDSSLGFRTDEDRKKVFDAWLGRGEKE